MENLIQDVRYAGRQLRKSPGFATVAVLTLALGIGANTGIFTLVNAVLLKSLPVPKPEQLYLVRESDRFAEQTRMSFPLYQRMAEAMPASASLAAMTRSGIVYFKGGSGQPETSRAVLVSGNYFQTFETYPAMGRLLTPADNQVVDGHPVAVISYEFWKSRLAADPNVIGREVFINGSRFNVVGVAAEHFLGDEPGRAPDFWLPLMMQSSLHYAQNYSSKTGADQAKPWVLQEDITWLRLVARVTEPAELARVSGGLNQLALQDAERNGARDAGSQSEVTRLESQLVLEPGGRGMKQLQREFSKPLLVLAAMVGMVLLIACANLAGLLLARASARTREMAVRLSIGATRRHLITQLLTECLLLSTIGGVVGIGVAYACDAVLPRWASSGTVPIPLNLMPDARVLLFSIGIVAVTGVLFGLAPALQAAAIEPVAALKASASRAVGGHGRGSWPLRQGLIVTQLVLALVLLVGAGLFLRTLRNFVQVDPGFDRNHTLAVWLETNERHYRHDRLIAFFHETLDRVQALPGVRSASLATCGLAAGCRSSSDIYLPGQAQLAATPETNIVSVGYFGNVGMVMLRGRDFAWSDDEKAPHVAIINQTLARKVFGTTDPIGQRFGYETKSANEFLVVGVVADAQVNGVLEGAPPMMYFPLFQDVSDIESLDVRTASDPVALAAQVRQILMSIDPDLPVARISTMSEQVSRGLAQQRLIARLTAIFGGLALGLACLGLYGVMSYTVARRTGELGVRLALGATRESVLGLVMRQTLFLAGAGIAGGLLLSLLMAHFVRSLLFGLGPYDLATMFTAAMLLLGVSVTAGLRPAWRAAKLDPMVALRYE
jgi:predicted permease